MKRLVLVLALAVAAVQWPLWMGAGGRLKVLALERELAERQAANDQLRERNRALGFEIASLQQGSEAIEERARADLHMMRPDETFFQWRPSGEPALARGE